METDNAVTLLRSLKGAPLSVLIAIRLFPGPASLLQLAAATGYERTAVTQAVTGLELMGLVERAHYRGWQLSRAAAQLPLWTPSEIGTIAPDVRSALSAGAEVDRPQPSNGVRELKAGKNHFQEDGSGTSDAPGVLKAVKNHFQQNGPDAAGEPPILKAVKNHFQQTGPDAAGEPQMLKAGKNHFQQDDPESVEEPEILKAVKNHFQPDAAGEPQMLKAGKNHFQQDDPESAEDPAILKAVKNHFQAPDPAGEALKAGKNHFQPGDRGSSSSSSLINLTTEVKEPLLLPQEGLKAGKNHFQPAEPEDTPPPFDDAEQDLLQDLIDLTGCPRRRAETAIRRARTDGADTSWLHLQVLYWHAYLVNGHANNIQNPGYFVAKKLEEDEACPLTETVRQHYDKADTLSYRWRKTTGEIS